MSNGEDIPITYGEQLSSNGQNQPGRTPEQETISSDMSALLEETLLLYSPINNKRNVPASKVETSYRPVRKETLNHKNANDRRATSNRTLFRSRKNEHISGSLSQVGLSLIILYFVTPLSMTSLTLNNP